jgi:hypothetical protein
VICYLTFETPKPEMLKCWFHTLSPFGIREQLCVVVQHLKSQNPESRNPKMLVPHYLVLEFGDCCVLLIDI